MTKSSSPPLAGRLTANAIRLNLAPGSKAEVVQALADLATGTGRVLSPARFHAALLEREALCSTALPGGVALVHPRPTQPGILSGAVLAFGRTVAPVDFGADDGERTQLFLSLGRLTNANTCTPSPAWRG